MKNCKLLFQDRVYLFSFLALAILIVVMIIWSSTSAAPRPSSDSTTPSESPDTFIPEGFALVPIELENGGNFEGIVDRFALVDLFELTDATKKKQKKVASRVQLIRAPLNHEHFAVLVAEKDTANVLSALGPLRAVIKNPKDPGHAGSGITYSKGVVD